MILGLHKAQRFLSAMDGNHAQPADTAHLEIDRTLAGDARTGRNDDFGHASNGRRVVIGEDAEPVEQAGSVLRRQFLDLPSLALNCQAARSPDRRFRDQGQEVPLAAKVGTDDVDMVAHHDVAHQLTFQVASCGDDSFQDFGIDPVEPAHVLPDGLAAGRTFS